MPKGQSGDLSENSLHCQVTRRCGKQFTGTAERVEMLIRLHRKICKQCADQPHSNEGSTASIVLDGGPVTISKRHAKRARLRHPIDHDEQSRPPNVTSMGFS